MKKFFVIMLFLVLVTSTSAFASKLDIMNVSPATGILCTQNMKICSVGKHIMRTNGSKPLYVSDGIVCTPNMKLCTNGYTYMRSYGTIQRFKSL